MKKYTLACKYIIPFLLILLILMNRYCNQTEHFVQGIINLSRATETIITNTINQTQGYATKPSPFPWKNQYPHEYIY